MNNSENKNPRLYEEKIYDAGIVKDFELAHIFECGQCFRWNRESDGSYTGIAFGKVINVALVPERDKMASGDYHIASGDASAACSTVATPVPALRLVIRNCEEGDFEEIWRAYFDLTCDYGIIKQELAKDDPVLSNAITYGHGIRILRQDTWEAIVSFIISQNNNIPRIKGCIEKLCKEFGNYVGIFDGKDYYTIPTPGVLARLEEQDLASCKLGYRAKYLIETSKQIIEICGEEGGSKGNLALLDQMSTDEAREFLENLPGVGPKVANCILLFGLSRIESFPIDVWVRKVMHELYDIAENNIKAMTSFAKERFGEYGGIAQQYLFYYMRENTNQ